MEYICVQIFDHKHDSISYVCRDVTGRVQLIYREKIGGYQILVVEMLGIQKAFQKIIQEKLTNIIASDSLTPGHQWGI